jgi:hypothetical protein
MNGNLIIKGLAWEFMEKLFATGGAIPPQDIEIAKTKKNQAKTLADHQPSARHIGKSKPQVRFDAVQTLAIEMMEEAGVEILLHSWIAGVVTDSEQSGRIAAVIIENKNGRQAIRAKVFVDCTGDADIVHFSGAPYEIRDKGDMYQIGRSYRIGICHDSDGAPVLRRIGAQYDGGDGTDAWDLTKAEISIWKKVWAKLQQLRKEPGNENAYILGWGEAGMIGIRETRRLVGAYTLTEEDIVSGKKFEDAIARSACPIDMHLQGGHAEDRIVEGDYYEIPYRTLYSSEIDNLLVAGRCISCTAVAEASIRKVPVCMATGEAAGVASALATKGRTTPRELDITALQNNLDLGR